MKTRLDSDVDQTRLNTWFLGRIQVNPGVVYYSGNQDRLYRGTGSEPETVNDVLVQKSIFLSENNEVKVHINLKL